MNIILLRQEEVRDNVFSFKKTDERFRHIKKVLKLGIGSVFKAGIINGKKGAAEITAFSEELLTARFTAMEMSVALPRVRLILGFPRPIQLRRILCGAAGLGIEALYLTGTELGEKSYLQADIAAEQELERLLIEGCCQAGETHIPQVYRAYSLRSFFERYGAAIRYDHARAVLDVPVAMQGTAANAVSALSGVSDATRTETQSGTACYPLTALRWNGSCPLWLAVGNERGWSRNERVLFAEKQFTSYNMGNRILRTETAVVSALAVSLALSGAWDHRTPALCAGILNPPHE